MSNEIAKRVEDSLKTEITIDESRKSFTAVAKRCSILFFTICDLSLIDPMYQFSL